MIKGSHLMARLSLIIPLSRLDAYIITSSNYQNYNYTNKGIDKEVTVELLNRHFHCWLFVCFGKAAFLVGISVTEIRVECNKPKNGR